MLTAIRQWVIKTMMKDQTGVVRTLPKQQMIEMNVQITAERFMRNGINPEDMKNVNQVENVINQIDTPKVNVNPGMTSGKKADVLDMEGNKINTSKGIMGGKEINQKNLNEELMKTDNPYSDLVNTPRPKTIAEREAEVLAGMEKNNKEVVERIRERKRLKDLEDPEEKADGGRIGLLAGSVPKISSAISALLKNKKKVQQAVDDIFPTGDYKYDADMAADALVENNPKEFNNLLREDLSDEISSEIYGTVLKPIMSNMAEMRELRKATRPEKTLQSMKEGKGINMSNPEIADEFGRFMKETDPKGYKELEQKIELSNFKTKDRKGNADGGRIGYATGSEPPEALRNLNNEVLRKNVGSMIPTKLMDDKDYLMNRINDRSQNARSIEDSTPRSTRDRSFTFSPEVNEIYFPATGGPNISGVPIPKSPPLATGGPNISGVPIPKRPTLSPAFLGSIFDFKNIEEEEETPSMKYADGGRIGLKAGMTKRGFLKLMGSVGAGIGAAKSGIFSGFGKGAGKQVAKEVAQQTTSGMPPPYFFKLAEKIKTMGTDVTSTSERTITKSLKSKNGKSEYILEEDMATGDTLIKKVNKEGDDMITDVEIMELRKGEDVVTKDGKAIKTQDQYEEVTETNSRINKDNYNASSYEDGMAEESLKDIIEEASEQAPSIKYASGGLAYMLGE